MIKYFFEFMYINMFLDLFCMFVRIFIMVGQMYIVVYCYICLFVFYGRLDVYCCIYIYCFYLYQYVYYIFVGKVYIVGRGEYGRFGYGDFNEEKRVFVIFDFFLCKQVAVG